MIELKNLQTKQEGGALFVEYDRLEGGAPRYDKFGSFAAKATAEFHFVACYSHYLLNAPETVKAQYASAVARLENLMREPEEGGAAK